MGIRRNARESALQILFQLEFDDRDLDLILNQYWLDKTGDPEILRHCNGLVKGVVTHLNLIDEFIQSVSDNWRISRMVLVDRNILRIAAYELFWGEKLDAGIVINEAIEIAKRFSGEQSAKFINGILDALQRNSREIKKELKERGHE